jgi:hypothetical protein
MQPLNQHGEVAPPSGCRWCGIAEREHVQLWTSGHGWHGWEPPTALQRRHRMLARRAASLAHASSAAISTSLRKIS